MGENRKALLYLIVIAVLVACTQTMDYNDQVEDEKNATRDTYVAWHNEIMSREENTK